MYMKQRCWWKRCNSNVYCRDILLFLLLYHHAYTGNGTMKQTHNLVVHGFFIHIQDMDKTIQQYLRRTRESNKKEMIAIIRYLLDGKFDIPIAWISLYSLIMHYLANSDGDHLYIFCSCFSSSRNFFNIYYYNMYIFCLVATIHKNHLFLDSIVYFFFSYILCSLYLFISVFIYFVPLVQERLLLSYGYTELWTVVDILYIMYDDAQALLSTQLIRSLE